MKEELLSIVTHALMGIDVEKEAVDMIVEQSYNLAKEKIIEAWNSAYGGDDCQGGEDYFKLMEFWTRKPTAEIA